jgi:hypothetical protein
VNRHVFLLLAACGCGLDLGGLGIAVDGGGLTGCGGDAFSTIDAPVAESGPAETGPEANTDAPTEASAPDGEASAPDGADAPDSGGAESGPDAAGDAAQDTGTQDAEPDAWQTCVQQGCSTGCCPGTFCFPLTETCEACFSAGAHCNTGASCCSGSCNLSLEQCNP